MRGPRRATKQIAAAAVFQQAAKLIALGTMGQLQEGTNMASRISRYSLGLLALLAAQWASAVGLGEITLQSAMNEPLRAEIALLSIGDLNESQIVTKLASPDDFDRAGVEREFQLADLRFKVDLSSPGKPVIRVSSQRPMKEPYLNFLLELRWTSGRLLREYTLLLDLPTFAGVPPAGKTAAAVPPTAAASPRSEAPASEPPQRRVAARGAARPSTPADGSYRVQAGDTLWGIAARNQPRGVTVQQAMQAIRAANPDAFIRSNPNLIRRDAVLNLPDAAAMAAVDQGFAKQQLQAAQPVADRVIESRARTAEKSSPGSENGELRLAGGASSADAGAAAMGGGDRESGGAADAARTDIGSALEEKDRVERENAELRARVASLEEQLKATSRLVEISDPTLAALQKGGTQQTSDAAADAGKPADTVEAGAVTPVAEAPLSGAPAESATSAEPGTLAGQTDDAAQASSAPDASAAAPETVTAGSGDAVAPAAPVTPEAPPAGESPLDVVAKLRPWLVPALGLTGILLLVAMGVTALRGRATQQQGLRLPSEELEAKGPRPAAFDRDLTAPVALDHEDLLPTEASFNEGPDQILEEVDVCLSFGNEQQASELLTAALARYPRHSGLHLKMLGLLAQQGDRLGFEAALPKLEALNDPGATESANALRRELQEPEEAPTPVVSAPTAPVAVAAAAVNPVDVALVEGGASENLDFDLDLDLDLDMPEAPPTVAAETRTQPEVSDELEDFDFDLLDNDLLDNDLLDSDLPDNELTNSAEALVEPPVAATAESWQVTSLDGDLDLFEPGQEMATQIELAEAYVDMGDAEGAREILDYVLQGGDEAQKESARQLLARLG
jgi:pilus assembly protein FimV